MNKNVLKIFAINARKELIEKIQIKAMQYGIDKDNIKDSKIQSSDSVVISGKPLGKEEKHQREKLILKIKSINESGEDGYNQVIEEVAYTWFNRFTALRFMEVNDYLPTRVRALSSSTGSAEPELIKEANNVNLPVDKQKIYEMKLNNDIDGLFKYMIIAQCNDLNKSLPFMFEKIGHYTELLFPDGLLNEGSFIRNLTDVDTISESDWKDIEIIGWLYQYYISEEKDRVIQAKKKYKKDEIPFATQLFTPDWIVRYMVQNSLGRYWVESHPEQSDLKNNWEFYLENPNPEPDFEEKLKPYINKELKVEDIKCFDPAMGSGHILVYMFDVLYQIYEKCGYMNREIPKLIIENNLYGLDIDDRAYQLACFAVIMKGMQYNNRLLRNIEREAERTGKEGIKLYLASIQETNELNNDDIIYIAGESSGINYEKTKSFIEQFKNAKMYGSLIKVDKFDKEFFNERLEYIKNNPAENIMQNKSRDKIVDLLNDILNQADIMVKNYDILVTNPPYMGSKYMSTELSEFIGKSYPETKSDTFSAFMNFCMKKVKENGHLGFLTPFVWMFISTYEKLREYIVYNKNISSLIQLEYNAFPEACVPVASFTLRNYNNNVSGEYIKLSDFTGSENQSIKVLEAINKSEVYYRYTTYSSKFNKISGSPIAYWVSEKVQEIFNKANKIGDFAEPRLGMATADNDRFLRMWYEIDFLKIGFDIENREEAQKSKFKWFPYNKGGEFRKWYGNNDYVVNWENDGAEIRNFKDEVTGRTRSHNYNFEYIFRESITWSFISSTNFGVRYSPKGFLFDVGGSSVFPSHKDIYYLTTFLCSKLTYEFLKTQNPTMNFQPGNIASLPLIHTNSKEIKERIDNLALENIEISKQDWDSLETSWNFSKNALLKFYNNVNKIKEAFDYWNQISTERFIKLKSNEEELNKLFINIYELNEEMNSHIEENDVTLNVVNKELEIRNFISYAVGCILGRYSLDQDGLVYAGGNFDYSKYNSFPVDEDNIIPILSDGYFEDDIVKRFVDFVKVTFGEETLFENLEYIAETLGKKSNETAKECFRRYFINDFYKNHLQTYKNRPIYWLFTSGKLKTFNCLIYMHRYDKTTLSRIRTDYLHELQDRLDSERKSLVDIIEDKNGEYSTKEKSDTKKKLSILDKQISELKKYDEILHHMADMQIEIDLDDGVKVNYDKFKGLLAKII